MSIEWTNKTVEKRIREREEGSEMIKEKEQSVGL
jgi:hypothetical protein